MPNGTTGARDKRSEFLAEFGCPSEQDDTGFGTLECMRWEGEIKFHKEIIILNYTYSLSLFFSLANWA